MTDSPRGGVTIALPIFLLVLASIAAATVVTIAITFAGPPPRPAPVQLTEVAEALKGGRPLGLDGQTGQLGTAPPRPVEDERINPARDAAIAKMLGGSIVRGFYEDPASTDRAIRGSFTVGVWENGRWRTLRSAPDRHFMRWLIVTVGGMLVALAALCAVAWWVARTITRPVVHLAAFSETVRLGATPPDAVTTGPREVRTLARALTAMHERLASHSRNRTAMLAAIAHDLGTPLSRIAFWIERLPEDARGRAAADIDEMRAMLGDVLRFARDEQVVRNERIDLGSVIDSLADDLAIAGQPVTLEHGGRAVIVGDAAALRRLFSNLIENAIRYGKLAYVSWTPTDGQVVVRIDDVGPGFCSASSERLFEPFERGDPSRNRDTGGTGLGLAIVRSLVDAHGGGVALSNRPGGGRVEVSLPLA